MCSGECGNEYVVEEKTKEEIKTIIIYLQKGDIMYEVAQ